VGENLATFKLKLAYIHPFTFPLCDKDENQEIEPSLRKRNPLSYNQQKGKYSESFAQQRMKQSS